VDTFGPKKYPKPLQTFVGRGTQLSVFAAREGIKDLALIRVLAGKDAIPKPLPLYEGTAELKGKDFLALTVGCSNGQPPTCQVERILRVGLFSREEGGEKGKCWEAANAQTPGRSGGAMLDKQGRIIGLCSGNNRGERGYFCHISEIDDFLHSPPCHLIFGRKK
jgi:hypothetical protein